MSSFKDKYLLQLLDKNRNEIFSEEVYSDEVNELNALFQSESSGSLSLVNTSKKKVKAELKLAEFISWTKLDWD